MVTFEVTRVTLAVTMVTFEVMAVTFEVKMITFGYGGHFRVTLTILTSKPMKTRCAEIVLFACRKIWNGLS